MAGTRAPGRTAATLAVLALLAGIPEVGSPLDRDEQWKRIEFEVRELEREIEARGALYGDPAVDAYLQSVLERLFPENQGRLRVRAFRDSEFNAFAVATGNIYVNIGALLRMRNEAELAAVLGHEGAHVTEEHSYRALRKGKAMGAVGSVFGLVLTAGTGVDFSLGALARYSSMAGFSREHERESDEVGFRRSAQAGYDAAVGVPIFGRLARELEARKIEQGPYFFASHPRLVERESSYRSLAEGAPPGEVRRDEFLAATRAARLAALEMVLAHRDGTELVVILEDDDVAAELAPLGTFALGEGYRLRRFAGDEMRSVEQYRKCLETYPDFAPAWGALGRHYARTGDDDLAVEHLGRFLELSPDAREAPFARQALERLKKENTP